MRVRAILAGLGCVVLLAGCNPTTGGGAPGGGGTEKRLAELEKSVGYLKAQNTDLRVKLRTRNSFPGRSPLEDFFNSPEFWQCTYDSSWSDCSARCSANTAAATAACIANKPEGPERAACVEKAGLDGSRCLMNCPVQTSPLDPPSCAGGGGIPAAKGG